MIIEFPNLLSGTTASPGQAFMLGELLSGSSVSLSETTIVNPPIVSGLSLSVGQKTEGCLMKYPPDMFKLIFGESAIQTSTQLIINKADLTDLTPQNNNTAESLIVALLTRNLKAQKILFTQKIDFEYWGFGYSANKRIDTILLLLRSELLVTNTYEIADYDDNVNPMDY